MIRPNHPSSSARRRARRRGLTFVELLLVLFIFVVVGAGVVGSYLSIHVLSQHARETMVAMEDLKDMMERMNSTSFTSQLTNFPSGVANGPVTNIYATIVGGYTLPNQSVTVTYPAQSATRLEILVALSWSSSGRARTVALSTVKTSS